MIEIIIIFIIGFLCGALCEHKMHMAEMEAEE